MSAERFKIMSFNIRFTENNQKDKGDRHWNVRKQFVLQRIREINPDIFGTQEGSFAQNEFLKQELGDYEYYGVGRDDASLSGEMCALFFRREKFTLLKAESFWLSETPEKPSISFGALLPRVCSVIELKPKDSNVELAVANAHLDHLIGMAREQQIKVVLEKMANFRYPTIILGDFNCGFNSRPYQILKSAGLSDTYLADSLKEQNDKDLLTFHNYSQKSKCLLSKNGRLRIDWIFISEDFDVLDAGIRVDKEKENIASDHFPIFASLQVRKEKNSLNQHN